MLYMFSMISLSISLSLIWFFAVIYVGKVTAGKTPPGSVVICFLIIAGPVGWAILLIAWITDLIEKFYS